MKATTTAQAIYGRPTSAKRIETGVFWLLRLCTYFVLLCAAFIFWDIGTKGGAVIFKSSAPFINVPFLTEAPETLNVFDYQGGKRTMGDRAFRQFKAEHEAELKGVPVETYVYSAGGIFPNIVGTVLLVLGSMLIALVLGVLSAILPQRISDRRPVHPLHPAGDHQSRRRALDRLRPVRLRPVCHRVLTSERLAARRLADPSVHGPAGDHHRLRGGAQGRAQGLPRGLARAGRHETPDHQHQCAALRAAGHPDLLRARDRPRGRRDGARSCSPPPSSCATSCRGRCSAGPTSSSRA
jgi:hypothetical protein